MNRADLQRLQSIHGYPAVSIFAPTHRASPANRQDPIRVKNLVKQAAERLQKEFTKREAGPLLQRLERLAAGIDYRATLDGLAIFVSRTFAQAFLLPFAVKERVVVDATFATRDLVFALNRSPRYRLLLLSEKTTRLFSGVGETLSEYALPPFPITDSEPKRSEAGRGNFTIEKTAYHDERHRHFFHQVDVALTGVLAKEALPVIVVGGQRPLAFFQEVSHLKNHVVGSLTGAYEKTAPHALGKLVWPLVEQYLEGRRDEAKKELDAAIHAKKYVSGIQEAWTSAHEGRGNLLLVEQGFYYPAKLDGSGRELVPASDATAPGVMDDAVDEVIEAVLAKGGRVVFLRDGALAEHGRMALTLRY